MGMTGKELAAALLRHAKEIAPEVTVIVFAAADGDDASLAMANASPYDLTTVVHMATDWLLEDMNDLLDRIDAGEAGKVEIAAEKPS